MKISTRLLLLGGVMSAIMILIAGLGLFGMNTANTALLSIYQERTVPTAQLGRIESLVLANRLAIAVALVTPTPEVVATSSATVESNIATITKTWELYMANPNMSPEEKKLAQSVADDRKRFVQEGLIPAVAALRANDAKESERIAQEKIRPLYVPFKKGIESLIQLQVDQAKQEFTVSEATYETVRNLSIVIFVLGMLISGAYNVYLMRSIMKQLGAEPAEATDVAQSVGSGDLTVDFKLKAGDTTSLMAHLKSMQESLVKVVGNVRQGSDGVATASAEIAQGNNDLSARTENQASALEQTASSMEQIGATVKQNADSARQANQLAMNASSVAIKGGEVVSQVVETMKGINESSRKISDIISVIDGIAFQTNILALNAAVEAARAGEQGRGFAVVASEVRSLAGRSAEAAKEIKSLINASVERVEHGTTLVDQAGTTMTEVVSSIRRVTDIMGEISAASSEQSLGISQVSEAVSQMDQVTQQNAALVEEMAAAASSLKSQADDLVHTVAVFKLPAGQSSFVARSAPTAQPRFTASKALPVRKAAPSVAYSPKKPAYNPPAKQVALSAPDAGAKASSHKPAPAPAADDGWDAF